MTNRITKRDLELVVERINHVTESPAEPYTMDADGKYHANVGNYHLDGAYGGWKLVRMVNEAGGIANITTGFIPKRDLYYQMHAYLDGIIDCKVMADID